MCFYSNQNAAVLMFCIYKKFSNTVKVLSITSCQLSVLFSVNRLSFDVAFIQRTCISRSVLNPWCGLMIPWTYPGGPQKEYYVLIFEQTSSLHPMTHVTVCTA